MGSNLEVFVQLRRALPEKGSLTPQEQRVLDKCYAEANRGFLRGFTLGGAIAWAVHLVAGRMKDSMAISSGVYATQKLRSKFRVPIIGGIFRVAIIGGNAFFGGEYAFERSLNSCFEDILALNGSQMQNELATIIMKNYRDNTSLMRLMSRHFYAENMFDDSSSDSTVIRWRYRNFFSDNVVYSPHGDGSQAEYGDSPNDHGSQAGGHVTSVNDSNDRKASVKSKQLPISNNSDAMDDPLDQIFGDTTPVEEIQLPSGTGTPSKEPARNHKRSHHRRRQRQHEVSSDWDRVQPQRI